MEHIYQANATEEKGDMEMLLQTKQKDIQRGKKRLLTRESHHELQWLGISLLEPHVAMSYVNIWKYKRNWKSLLW